MARTPFLRTLMQLAADNAAAEERGVTPEQIRAERRERGMTRREVLAAGAAALASMALPKFVRAAGTSARIAIVGGGIAGLSAALTLADAGFGANVTVYEASGRIGGRMFSNSKEVSGTAYWSDDQCTEWCGELIDSGHETIQALAARFNLPLADRLTGAPAGSEPTYFVNGGYYTLAQINADFAPLWITIKAQINAAIAPQLSTGGKNVDGTVLYNAITATGVALDNMSVRDWISTYVPGGLASRMGKILDVAYSSEFGADTDQQSSLNMLLMLAFQPKPKKWTPFGISDERYHVIGGNQRIPLAIAAHLGSQIVKTGWRLTKVAQAAGGAYDLGFTVAGKPKTITADHVILSLPFAVLSDAVDTTHAGFDALKRTAITQLGRGQCSKLQVQTTARPWQKPGAWGAANDGDEIFTDIGDDCSWEVSKSQPGASGIMNSYTGGQSTLDRVDVAPVSFAKISSNKGIGTLSSQFLGQLDTVFKGANISHLWNGKATLSIPHLDPNMGLSYSYWKVGQYQTFAGYERVAQGNCHFAGEHCSVNFQGFMEGGASEGVRAANEVLAKL
jgi:monoamine oxidase